MDFVRICLLLDLVEKYKNVLKYRKLWNKFDRVVSNKKQALVNYDAAEGEFIVEFLAMRRSLTSLGVKLFLDSNPTTQKSFEKGLRYDAYLSWFKRLKEKLPSWETLSQSKLLTPILTAYGKGFDKGMSDQKFVPKGEWRNLPGQIVPKMTTQRLIFEVSKELSSDMAAVVLSGLDAGKDSLAIAKELRSIATKPKHVKVPSKLDPITGKVLRKGYEYDIPMSRYSEMIGRTEVNRSTNLGRLESYERGGYVKSVSFVTAGDGKVCPSCEVLQDTVTTVDKAFSLVPVHVMCRCTWEAYEYHSSVDPEEARANYVVGKVDRALNSTYFGLTSTMGFFAASALYAKHLKSKGFPVDRYSEVYLGLENQLHDLVRVPSISNWKPEISHLYALHEIRNIRLYLAVLGKFGLEASSYTFEETASNNLSSTTNNPDTDSLFDTTIYSGSMALSNLEFSNTVTHEVGHNYYSMDDSRFSDWASLHDATDEFVSAYSLPTPQEDLAESLAYYLHSSTILKQVSSKKYSYLSQHLFEN